MLTKKDLKLFLKRIDCLDDDTEVMIKDGRGQHSLESIAVEHIVYGTKWCDSVEERVIMVRKSTHY